MGTRRRGVAHTPRIRASRDDVRLLHAYKEPETPPVARLALIAAWLVLRGVGAELARRLREATRMPVSEPSAITHLRSTGVRAAQPAHTDSPEPWVMHGQLPGVSVIIALHDDTPVTVYSGSHRLFLRLRSLRVPRSKAGDPTHLTLKTLQAIFFGQDVIQGGGDKVAGPGNDRLIYTCTTARRHLMMSVAL